ncbi:MAG: hypothetical protein AAF846_26615 [Chloroflexota bacterium]
MSAEKQHSVFETIILQAWAEGTEGVHGVWRFRVHDVRTGEIHIFATLGALLHHLHSQFNFNSAIDITSK